MNDYKELTATPNGLVPLPPEVVAELEREREAFAATKDSREAQRVREHRNKLLSECDWTQLEDSPLSPENKLCWKLYRETLRMVPQQAGFPWDITWPPSPGNP